MNAKYGGKKIGIKSRKVRIKCQNAKRGKIILTITDHARKSFDNSRKSAKESSLIEREEKTMKSNAPSATESTKPLESSVKKEKPRELRLKPKYGLVRNAIAIAQEVASINAYLR